MEIDMSYELEKAEVQAQKEALRLNGVKQALSLLINEKCKKCVATSCPKCLYLTTALATQDPCDCRIVKLLNEGGF